MDLILKQIELMGFTITTSLDEEATHWMPVIHNIPIIYCPIRLFKAYPIVMDLEEQDYWIIDEEENYNMAFLVNEGWFLKMI